MSTGEGHQGVATQGNYALPISSPCRTGRGGGMAKLDMMPKNSLPSRHQFPRKGEKWGQITYVHQQGAAPLHDFHEPDA